MREKNQSPEQQKEAVQAVSIYYDMYSRAEEAMDVSIGINTFRQSIGDIAPHASFQPVNAESKSEGKLHDPLAEWKKAHTDLFAEIKTRHYSPKTLKSYALWIRQFQFFTKNKMEDMERMGVLEKSKELAANFRKTDIEEQNH